MDISKPIHEVISDQFNPVTYKETILNIYKNRIYEDADKKIAKCNNKRKKKNVKKDHYQLKVLCNKYNSTLEIIADRFMATDTLLFIRVDINIPTVEEVNKKLKPFGVELSPIEEFRLDNIHDSNKLVNLLKIQLQRQLDSEDAVNYFNGKKTHFNELAFIWVREFVGSDGRKHYHLLLMVNAHRFKTVGDYNSFPTRGKTLADKIAMAYIEALGLAHLEESFSNSNLPGKEGVILGGYVSFKTNKSYTWSRRIHRNMTQEDIDWLFYKLRYMFKIESKAIPEKFKHLLKPTERTFGRSECRYLGNPLDELAIRKKFGIMNSVYRYSSSPRAKPLLNCFNSFKEGKLKGINKKKNYPTA